MNTTSNYLTTFETPVADLLEDYGLTLNDICMEALRNAFAEGETPAQFVAWWTEKYDLKRLDDPAERRRARAKLIAAQNDAFRAQLLIPVFGKPAVSGRCVITSGIAALGPVAQIEITALVREFNSFTRDNDPHGERDFGAFDYEGEKVFWKIDYYDPTLTYGSEDPADLAKTRRVLTIMLASEY